MTVLSSETLHASCVAIGDRAVLISGPSGSGKSDLALRLIDRGAVLVSDDYTRLVREDGNLIASAPDTIAGKLEVRDVGIFTVPYTPRAMVALLIALDGDPVRLPTPELRVLGGVEVPVVALRAHDASAAIKVEHALKLHGRAA